MKIIRIITERAYVLSKTRHLPRKETSLKLGFSLVLAAVLIGCGSMPKVKSYRSSALSNLNPAPKSLAPKVPVSEAQLVDPVYMRSQADYHYTLGEALAFEGKNQRAIEEFKLTLVYDPNSVAVRLRLAAEFVKLGLMSEAVEQAESAIEIDPDSQDGRLLLGGLYSSLRMYEMAQQQYEWLLKKNPKDLEVPIYLGALLAEKGQFDEAEAVFKKLGKAKGNDNAYKAYYYIGRIRTEEATKASFKAAEKAYAKSLSLKPDDDITVLAMGRLYEKQNKSKKALKLLTSFQKKFGPKASLARVLSQKFLEQENYAKAYEQLELLEGFEPDNLAAKVKISLILIEQKKYKPAIDRLEDILRIAPDSDKIRFYLGAVYEEVKDFDSALVHFAKIPAESSYYSEAALHSAHLNKLKGKLKVASKIIEKAISVKPNVPQFYIYYASLLDEQKSYQKAISMLGGAVKRFPKDPQIHYFLGSMHDRVGNKKQTLEYMNKAVELDENHVQALNFIAFTYAEKGEQLQKAEEYALRALSLKPDDGYILDTVGWVLYKQGRVEESIKYLEAAYKNVNTESIIAEHLGDAYYRHDLLEKARMMYKKAASIAENERRVSEIRTKLKKLDSQTVRLPASTKVKAN